MRDATFPYLVDPLGRAMAKPEGGFGARIKTRREVQAGE
jgi:hypothetical protein